MTRVSKVRPGRIKASMPNTTAAIPRSRRSHQFLANACSISGVVSELEVFRLVGMPASCYPAHLIREGPAPGEEHNRFPAPSQLPITVSANASPIPELIQALQATGKAH